MGYWQRRPKALGVFLSAAGCALPLSNTLA